MLLKESDYDLLRDEGDDCESTRTPGFAPIDAWMACPEETT
jgi:hypothetical protein